jgi:hypothetical protein
LIRKTGIVEHPYFGLSPNFAGLKVDRVRQVKQSHEENTKRMQLLAELTLEEIILRYALRKKL